MMKIHRFILLALLAALPLAGQDKDKKETGKSVGFILSQEATAKEVGLPIYPGARPHKDESDDSPALKMGLWGPSSGFKLVVMKLESDDSPDKILAFYRKALAKYGQVLDCSNASATSNTKTGNSSSQLDCKDDQPEKGASTLKAGTKEKQHVVGIQANGKHSLFQLLYVETPKSD
jgi:hypothetical protein